MWPSKDGVDRGPGQERSDPPGASVVLNAAKSNK